VLNEMASGRFQQRTPNRRPKPFKGTKFCQLKASSPKERNAAPTDPVRFNMLIRHKIVAAKLERPFTAKPQRLRLGGGRTEEGCDFVTASFLSLTA
jgi:hypothetical protein